MHHRGFGAKSSDILIVEGKELWGNFNGVRWIDCDGVRDENIYYDCCEFFGDTRDVWNQYESHRLIGL